MLIHFTYSSRVIHNITHYSMTVVDHKYALEYSVNGYWKRLAVSKPSIMAIIFHNCNQLQIFICTTLFVQGRRLCSPYTPTATDLTRRIIKWPNSFKLESFSMEAIASVAHTVTGNRQPTLVHTLREIRWNIERGVENVLSNLITAKHDNSVSKWHQQLASMGILAKMTVLLRLFFLL